LSALEAGKTKAIRFDTLAKLCEFFSCTPNELLELELEAGTESPTVEELKKADEIISRGLARAIAASTRPAEEIWAEFDAVRARIATNALIKADRKTTAIGD
jgi:transcriptional regulator with XRE-family HTH domain